MEAVKVQQQTFDEVAGPKRKAMKSQRLLALLYYTALPLGHTKEFHTLQHQVFDTLPRPTIDPQMPNCLHITGDGREVYILLGDYKSHKTHFTAYH